MVWESRDDLGPDVARHPILTKRRVGITQPVIGIRYSIVSGIGRQEVFEHLSRRRMHATFEQAKRGAVGSQWISWLLELNRGNLRYLGAGGRAVRDA